MTWEIHKDANIEIVTGLKNPIKRWTVGIDVEHHAEAQLANAADLPFIFKHIAVMPDVHAGIGCTVGSVVPTIDVVVPAMVGVDIGCGMQAVCTTLTSNDLPDSLFEIRSAIEAAIPHGLTKGRDTGSWENLPTEVEVAWLGLEAKYRKIVEQNPKCSHRSPESQLGTLGTGNHFIEVCLDENNRVWLMLHSGSRGVGNRIGQHFIDLAKKDMKAYYINMPDINLAYLPSNTKHFKDYIEAVWWAQTYAKTNRELMMSALVQAIKKTKLLPSFELDDLIIDCHHNYVNKEKHFHQEVFITRKGAISARIGEWAIIPGSMGTKSYIVQGLGNKESFTSASHGAGRRMSRTAAKQQFTLKDHIKATEGVECRKDKDVIDETPMAYKDIDQVMEAQRDLVKIIHTLKQVVCVKG